MRATPMPCGDCGEESAIMFELRSPRGPWWLCNGCMGLTLREAEIDRRDREAKLANIERKQPPRRERVGSH